MYAVAPTATLTELFGEAPRPTHGEPCAVCWTERAATGECFRCD